MMMVLTAWLVRKNTPARVDRLFRRLQLVSAAIFSYSHGTNDAQKVMGIISVILYGTVWADRVSTADVAAKFPVPFWVVLALPRGDRARHDVRRLAHRADDGAQPDEAAPIGGFSGDRRRRHDPRARPLRHPGLDDAHHHRRDRRGRLDEGPGGALGRRRADHLGLGPDHSGRGHRGGGVLRRHARDRRRAG